MKCEECVMECKEQGGLCNVQSANPVHKYESHVMYLTGGYYRCLNLKAVHPPVEANLDEERRARQDMVMFSPACVGSQQGTLF